MRPAPKNNSVTQQSRVYPTRTLRREGDRNRNFGPSRDLVAFDCGDLNLTVREFDFLELVVRVASEQPHVFGADELINASMKRIVVGLADGILSKLSRVRASATI